MRTANSSASLTAPLHYPPGTAPADLAALPKTPREVLELTGMCTRSILVCSGLSDAFAFKML